MADKEKSYSVHVCANCGGIIYGSDRCVHIITKRKTQVWICAKCEPRAAK